MTVILMILIGVVFFVLGVSFVFRGYLTIPSTKEFVPLLEYRMLEESAHDTERSLRQVKEELEASRAQLQAARKEMENHKTVSQDNNRIQELEQEIEAVRGKAETQARESREVIDVLKKENEVLKQNVSGRNEEDALAQQQYAAQLAKTTADLEQLRVENQHLKGQKGEFLDRLRQVEAELSALENKQRQQLDEFQSRSKQNIEKLMGENQAFQAQLQEKSRQAQALQGIVDALESEKSQRSSQGDDVVSGLKTTLQMLHSQLEERAIKISQLEEKLASLQRGGQQELDEARSRLQDIQSQLDDLQNEKKSWDATRVSLEENLRKVKEFNGHLLDKDRMIQYELAKSRAQAMGFEKINEDFKTQLDEMYRTVESLRKG